MAAIDWLALARRLQDIQAQMIHHEDVQRYGDEFYAEALRRTLGFSANDGTDRGRVLPYETLNPSTGLTTLAEADHLRDSHTIIDRHRAEAAKKEAQEAREETRRVLRDAARDLAKLIRDWTNNRTVPSVYRREGALMAADWIDPDSPASPFTQPKTAA